MNFALGVSGYGETGDLQVGVVLGVGFLQQYSTRSVLLEKMFDDVDLGLGEAFHVQLHDGYAVPYDIR